MVELTAFCLQWQLSKSSSFDELLAPLKSKVKIKMVAWDGVNLPLTESELCKLPSPIIFWQFPPPPQILNGLTEKLVWIPMWDHVHYFSDAWWESIPEMLRVVAFSHSVVKKLNQINLKRYIRLKYYLDPEKYPPVNWTQEKVLYYWNRVGMVGPEFLKQFCLAQKIDVLFFRSKIDPLIPANKGYDLPDKIGKTRVIQVPDFLEREAYLEMISRANICITPRLFEGIGLVMLESMSRGEAVFAYDAPTMNEYIDHLKNGYLLERWGSKFITNLEESTACFLLNHSSRAANAFMNVTINNPMPMTAFQNWEEISGLDLEAMGGLARQSHLNGYTRWKESLLEYVEFILQ